MSESGELIIYQAEDGHTRVTCRVAEGTLWLNQAEIASLFETTTQNITTHISSIYEEVEQSEPATCKDYLQVRSEGKREVRRMIKHYSLPMILSIGYRVRSPRATAFRQWATARLEEYLVKGFAMDDARLKQSPAADYFDELLARIRDIRSSERVFYRKVLDIYATSVDYDGDAELSAQFFRVMQNKMHFAAHGQTAAEVIAARANATAPHMGLTSWAGAKPRSADAAIAKNYLAPEEIETLNLIVTAYLDFAELQARGRTPMTMKDWIRKLDDFLKLSDRELLTHAGSVSHVAAVAKAQEEFAKFRVLEDGKPKPVDAHFEAVVEQAKKLAPAKTRKGGAS